MDNKEKNILIHNSDESPVTFNNVDIQSSYSVVGGKLKPAMINTANEASEPHWNDSLYIVDAPFINWGDVDLFGKRIIHTADLIMALNNKIKDFERRISELEGGSVSYTLSYGQLNHMTPVSSNPTSLKKGIPTEIAFNIDKGWGAPVTLKVVPTGACSVKSLGNGRYELSNVTSELTLSGDAVSKTYSIAYSLNGITYTPNQSTISSGQSVEYTLTLKNPDKTEFGTIKVSNATSKFTSGTGKLTVSNPYGDVNITGAAVEIQRHINIKATDGIESIPETKIPLSQTEVNIKIKIKKGYMPDVTFAGWNTSWGPAPQFDETTSSIKLTGLTDAARNITFSVKAAKDEKLFYIGYNSAPFVNGLKYKWTNQEQCDAIMNEQLIYRAANPASISKTDFVEAGVNIRIVPFDKGSKDWQCTMVIPEDWVNNIDMLTNTNDILPTITANRGKSFTYKKVNYVVIMSGMPISEDVDYHIRLK